MSLEHRLVAVALKEGQAIEEAALKQAITEAGYTAVSIKVTDSTLDALRTNVHNQAHDDD